MPELNPRANRHNYHYEKCPIPPDRPDSREQFALHARTPNLLTVRFDSCRWPDDSKSAECADPGISGWPFVQGTWRGQGRSSQLCATLTVAWSMSFESRFAQGH